MIVGGINGSKFAKESLVLEFEPFFLIDSGVVGVLGESLLLECLVFAGEFRVTIVGISK